MPRYLHSALGREWLPALSYVAAVTHMIEERLVVLEKVSLSVVLLSLVCFHALHSRLSI